jgi:hypothetical protein
MRNPALDQLRPWCTDVDMGRRTAGEAETDRRGESPPPRWRREGVRNAGGGVRPNANLSKPGQPLLPNTVEPTPVDPLSSSPGANARATGPGAGPARLPGTNRTWHLLKSYPPRTRRGTDTCLRATRGRPPYHLPTEDWRIYLTDFSPFFHFFLGTSSVSYCTAQPACPEFPYNCENRSDPSSEKNPPPAGDLSL